MAEQSSGCSGETLLALCAGKKRLHGKITNCYTAGDVLKKILTCSVVK